jgi:DNA adenine methylase
MTDDNHRDLARVLHACRGMVVISGYGCDLYDQELYPTWHRVTREVMADGSRKRVEVLWFNPAATYGLRRVPLFPGVTDEAIERETIESEVEE